MEAAAAAGWIVNFVATALLEQNKTKVLVENIERIIVKRRVVIL